MINRLILDQNVLLADHLPHAGGRLSLTAPLPPLCNSLNFYKNLTGTAGVGGVSVDLRPPSRVSRRENPSCTDCRSKAPQAAEADDKEVPVPIRGTVFTPPSPSPPEGLTSAGHFLLGLELIPMLSERAHLCRTLRVSSCAPTWCRCMGTCPFPPLHPHPASCYLRGQSTAAPLQFLYSARWRPI